MSWNRFYKVSGFVGVAVCGACIAKVCNQTQSHVCTVQAETLANSAEDISQSEPNNLTLKQVHIFFRHGARTPLGHFTPGIEQVIYPADLLLRNVPYTMFKYKVCMDDESTLERSKYEAHYETVKLKGGCHAGMLTSKGQDQMYMLGHRLKKEYMENQNFLSPEFNLDEVIVRSTNINRTIQSARCVLAGIYGRDHLEQNGLVKILVMKGELEILFPNTRCPVYRQINHATMVHPDSLPGLKEDREILEKALGIDSTAGGKINFIYVYDDIMGRKAHGLPVPKHLNAYWPMIEENATRMLYNATCGQHERERKLVLRLTSGPALTMVVKAMEAFREGRSQQKLGLYSSHDSLLCTLLAALDIYDGKWPPFTADLRLELYEDDRKNNWVRVLYCGKEQIVRGCSRPLASYREFMDGIRPYTIERKEYNKICASNILETIAKELLAQEAGEVETPETKEKSELPAGM